MARIAGIKQHRTATGKLKSITIDVKKWGEYVQDILDLIEIERIKSSPDGEFGGTLEDVKKMLEKKHKIKL